MIKNTRVCTLLINTFKTQWKELTFSTHTAHSLMWITSVLVGAALVHGSYALLHGRGPQPRGSNDTNPEAIWTTVWTHVIVYMHN